jgi:hypothetical protein
MAKITKYPWSNMQGPTREIVKALHEAHSYAHVSWPDTFDDWIEMVHRLFCQPALLFQARQGPAALAQADPDTRLWPRLARRYERGWDGLLTATTALLQGAQTADGLPEMDILGPCYMAVGWANERAGQFFTPFEVSQVLAEISTPDLTGQIWQRLRDAYEASALSLMRLPTFEDANPARLEAVETATLVRSTWDHLRPHYDPIRIGDPACGSGGMLLAAAALLPAWVVHEGLVHFTGIDIDARCVRMCHIQMLLFGMHGMVMEANALDERTWDEAPRWVSPWRIRRPAPVVEVSAPTAEEIELLKGV